MTPFKPQVIREIHAPVPANDPMRDAPRDASALLIPFPGTEARRTRRLPKRAEMNEIATAARKAPTFCSATMTALTVVLSV